MAVKDSLSLDFLVVYEVVHFREAKIYKVTVKQICLLPFKQVSLIVINSLNGQDRGH